MSGQASWEVYEAISYTFVLNVTIHVISILLPLFHTCFGLELGPSRPRYIPMGNIEVGVNGLDFVLFNHSYLPLVFNAFLAICAPLKCPKSRSRVNSNCHSSNNWGLVLELISSPQQFEAVLDAPLLVVLQPRQVGGFVSAWLLSFSEYPLPIVRYSLFEEI